MKTLTLIGLGMALSLPLKTGFVDVGKTKLYYEEMGQGGALIMIHGGLLDCRMWDPQFEVFAEEYRTIRYDVRNHGRSAGVEDTFTTFDDLGKLLDQLKIQQAAIMGLSMGGRIAIDFAIAHPEKVSALILAAPGASGYDFEKDDSLTENNEGFDEALGTGDIEKAVEYFQRSWTDGPHRSPSQVDPEVRDKVKAMALQTLKNWNNQSKMKELEPPAFGRLAEIRAPTLAIVGALDMPSILEIVDRVEKDVSGAEVVMIPDVAHMVNMEKPEAFNQAVLDFLAKH